MTAIYILAYLTMGIVFYILGRKLSIAKVLPAFWEVDKGGGILLGMMLIWPFYCVCLSFQLLAVPFFIVLDRVANLIEKYI